MTIVNHYRIDSVNRASVYASVLTAVGPHAAIFGVIVRMKDDVMSQAANRLLDDLQSHLIIVERVKEWPGTQMFGDRAVDHYLYRLDAESLAVLVASAERFGEWVNPLLPEDLHLLREDRSVILGTIAQEEEVWLELTSIEYQEVAAKLPPTVRLLKQA